MTRRETPRSDGGTAMARKSNGNGNGGGSRLIIIGGHEEKDSTKDRAILEEVARTAADRGERVLVLTVASQLPHELGRDYRGVFRELGVKHVDVLDVRTR